MVVATAVATCSYNSFVGVTGVAEKQVGKTLPVLLATVFS
jgi:hypothetical protein